MSAVLSSFAAVTAVTLPRASLAEISPAAGEESEGGRGMVGVQGEGLHLGHVTDVDRQLAIGSRQQAALDWKTPLTERRACCCCCCCCCGLALVMCH